MGLKHSFLVKPSQLYGVHNPVGEQSKMGAGMTFPNPTSWATAEHGRPAGAFSHGQCHGRASATVKRGGQTTAAMSGDSVSGGWSTAARRSVDGHAVGQRESMRE
ncbi:hypothetical protein NL676_036359 [Syzygium grande]|nr:hypothetical protein NL676_036359 [Syzygium grande]